MKSWVRDAARRARMPGYGYPPLQYSIDTRRIAPELQEAFVELDVDKETSDFLTSCDSGGLFESFVSTVLGMFYSLTDVNGMLGRGQMFVLSQEQICQVLRKKPEDFRGKLLDIGAGDGNVTGKMAHFMDHVTTTEVSGPMVKNLNNKGFNCIQTFDLNHEKLISGGPYKVISLLNVLDRADKPLTMLRQIRSLLDPQYGVLLLAVVLPFSAFVEVGTQKLPPSEILPMRGGLCAEGASFEDAANVLLKNVLIPNGFKLRTFSRVPYLCRGDLQQPYYVLCDGIFVLEVDPNFSTGVTTN